MCGALLVPTMIAIDGRSELVQLTDHSAIAPDEGVDNDSAAAATDIHDALLDIDGTRLTHEQENIDDDNSALNIDLVPFALQSAPTQTTYLPAQRRGRGVDSLQSLLSHNEPTIV